VRLYIAILCGIERTGWICPPLVDWIMAGKVLAGVEANVSLISGCWPVDHARNVAVELASRSGSDWILMVDNDQRPHAQTLDVIALADARGFDIVGFPYPLLAAPDVIACSVQLGEVADAKHDDEFKEVPEFGSGCMAVRMSIFERLARPYFKIGIDPEMAECGLGHAINEDLAFCRAARAAGLRTHVARGITADHFKTMSLLGVLESQARL
jgi:hypothetical protein